MESISKEGSLNSDLILNFVVNSRFRVLRHLCLIFLLGAAFYYTPVEFAEPINTFAKVGLFVVLLSLFYINMYKLVPSFLFRDNYFGYFLWLIGLFVVIQLLAYNERHIIFAYIRPATAHQNDKPNLFAVSFVFIILIGASAAVKLFQRSIADNQRISDLETNTIKAELEHLKKQINPHFLFNTLNNANVLTQKDPEKASRVLMKLSDLLRYQLYDSARNKVFLTSDIRFLEDFLNLEKIRRDKFDFGITQEGPLSGVEIPPLLFITFIENAVKHNMDIENTPFVYVFFKLIGNDLHFNCINSKPKFEVSKNTNGGLGLANVYRRLELLYPGKHTVNVQDNHETFSIDLKINL
jgi:sensor histidine kinase YesM